jgi:hypothetical protein
LTGPGGLLKQLTNTVLETALNEELKARGHFPSEQAALTYLYLVTRSLDPTGRGRARWAMRWKPALNAFSITFADRFPAALRVLVGGVGEFEQFGFVGRSQARQSLAVDASGSLLGQCRGDRVRQRSHA